MRYSPLAGVLVFFCSVPSFGQLSVIDDLIKNSSRTSRALNATVKARNFFSTAHLMEAGEEVVYIIHVDDGLKAFISADEEILIADLIQRANRGDLPKVFVENEFNQIYEWDLGTGRVHLPEAGVDYSISHPVHVSNIINAQTWEFHEDDILSLLDIYDARDKANFINDLGRDRATPLVASNQVSMDTVVKHAGNKLLIIPGYFENGSFTNQNGDTTFFVLESIASDLNVYCIYLGFKPGVQISHETIQGNFEEWYRQDSIHHLPDLLYKFLGNVEKKPVFDQRFDGKTKRRYIEWKGDAALHLQYLSFATLGIPPNYIQEDKDIGFWSWVGENVILSLIGGAVGLLIIFMIIGSIWGDEKS